MNTEELIDTTITNLKIIAMVKKNGKLCVRKGQLTIEPDDHIQMLRRWYNRDSRELTMMHIRNTINNAIKVSKGLIDNQIETELREWTLNKLYQEMLNSQNGLINLKTTYIADSICVASLDVLIDRLTANCESLGKVLKNKSYEDKKSEERPQKSKT